MLQYVHLSVILKNPLPEDLRIMGEVTKFEYDCWAIYIENNADAQSLMI